MLCSCLLPQPRNLHNKLTRDSKITPLLGVNMYSHHTCGGCRFLKGHTFLVKAHSLFTVTLLQSFLFSAPTVAVFAQREEESLSTAHTLTDI